MTTKEQIREWLEEGKNKGATHVMVVCDQFDWEDYPVYIMPDEVVEQCFENISTQNMQKVMEIYDLAQPLQSQLDEEKTWRI